MTIYIWRYSHLILAISSSIFLLLASITGAILAIEPVVNKVQPYSVADANTLSVARLLQNVDGVYQEVLTISKDKNDFVSISAIIEGKTEKFYIDPFTGKKIGDHIEKASIYRFVTNLHRSLFLKSTGRFFVGLTSFLLVLIALSGLVLIGKQKGSIFKFFTKITKENNSQFLHIFSSRLALIPILIIAISGVYLSLLRFELIEERQLLHDIDFDNLHETPKIPFDEFSSFKKIKFDNFKEIAYPFSEFIEDYYHLKTNKRELLINQFTGEVLSVQEYPFVALASKLATVLHTGQGSIIWSIVLGLSSLCIPFLMYTGFAMYFKRPRNKIKNLNHKDDCTYVLLVGSEGGTTMQFANVLYQEFQRQKLKCYIAELNAYSVYNSLEHLLVLTATYGQGEAPSNAINFLEKLASIQQKSNVNYAVVGFGSTLYPEFCAYAEEVNLALSKNKSYTALMPIQTVNDKSFEEFAEWANNWSKNTGVKLQLNKNSISTVPKKITTLIVEAKTTANASNNDTFLLTLEATKRFNGASGDLLAIYAPKEKTERLYSISVFRDEKIVLAVKKHEFGVCSTYLNSLKANDSVRAYLIKNKKFHFPKNAKKVIVIATGTGIGPFLGMMENNTRNIPLYAYWGGVHSDAYKVFQPSIETFLTQGSLREIQQAYSRENEQKVYVQDLVLKDKNVMAEVLANKGCIMICGSLAMQKEILAILNKLCIEQLQKALSYYQNKGQIKMDCY